MLFLKKDKYTFVLNKPIEEDKNYLSPSRGFYSIFPFLIEREWDKNYHQTCLNESETLVLVNINIGAAKNRDLKDTELNNFENIISFFKANNKDIILRIVYDQEGKGLEKEPNSLEQILNHIRQLTPVIKKYNDSIFVIQGALVGNWGEMHGSRYLKEDKLNAIMKLLDKAVSKDTFLAVRTPYYWRMLNSHSEYSKEFNIDETYFKNSNHRRMGLYDDAIMAGDDDLGTFNNQNKTAEIWKSSWSKDNELLFIDKLTRINPAGGEILSNDRYPELEEIIDYLKKLHITYLNSQYDRKILDYLKTQYIRSDDIYNGMNGYDYIERHLGYRYIIKNLKINENTRKNNLEIIFDLENKGFAPAYQESEIILRVIDKENIINEYLIDYDLRNLNTTARIKKILSLKEGEIYLLIRRKNDSKTIPLCLKGFNEDKENGYKLVTVKKK